MNIGLVLQHGVPVANLAARLFGALEHPGLLGIVNHVVHVFGAVEGVKLDGIVLEVREHADARGLDDEVGPAFEGDAVARVEGRPLEVVLLRELPGLIRGAVEYAGLAPRITSYNVCYTKLLRDCHGIERRDGLVL